MVGFIIPKKASYFLGKSVAFVGGFLAKTWHLGWGGGLPQVAKLISLVSFRFWLVRGWFSGKYILSSRLNQIEIQ